MTTRGTYPAMSSSKKKISGPSRLQQQLAAGNLIKKEKKTRKKQVIIIPDTRADTLATTKPKQKVQEDLPTQHQQQTIATNKEKINITRAEKVQQIINLRKKLGILKSNVQK